LQEAFLEIAFRANRLREWVDLDKELRVLELSFGDFTREVSAVVVAIGGGGAPVNTGRMGDLWSRISETDFVDLQSFSDSLKYINRASRAEQSNGAGNPSDATALTKVSLEALFDLTRQIQKAIDEAAYKKLQQRCLSFQQGLKKEISMYKQSVRQELLNLCEMTSQVRMQL